jgi:superfamily II DNA/RNA helicase
VAKILEEKKINSITLHGDISIKKRIEQFENFNDQKVKIMISTDLGSRGLDFPFLSHVINYDFPNTSSDYLHRAGRTGRAGRKGIVVSLYTKTNI